MPASATDRPLLALLFRLIGIAGFALMAVCIKLASESGVHLLELIFWRQFITLPIMLAWAMLAGGLVMLKTARPKAHALRAAYGVVGMLLNFGGVILLPLAEATTLSYTGPIFAVLLSIVLLKEAVGVWRWSAVIAGFAGIIIIAQPGTGAIPLTGAMVALGGAFMIALIAIQIRDLGRTEAPMVIVFWFALATVLVTAPALPLVHQPLSGEQWLLLLGIGLFGTWGQVFITMALRFGEVSSVIVMDYSSLIWAALFGWLIFGDLPTLGVWLGAPFVIGSGIVITWRERVLRKARLAAATPPEGT